MFSPLHIYIYTFIYRFGGQKTDGRGTRRKYGLEQSTVATPDSHAYGQIDRTVADGKDGEVSGGTFHDEV